MLRIIFIFAECKGTGGISAADNIKPIMSEYIVSARKYRPVSFDTVVGQTALITTLKNAVRSGRLAHAYLFCGPRGVGKTTCARIFAKAINCQNPSPDGEACNKCESCTAFNEQRSYSIFELDAAGNNSVENIKQLMEQTRIPPQTGRYKVFIIDEVHMLSTQAFNAFLKTLEEPPAHVIFILATTEKQKILPTIISRCQIYDFERMTVDDITGHLRNVAAQEGVTCEDEALAMIAEKADGGMRDALSIFDQAMAFCGGDITAAKVAEDLNMLDADNYFDIIDMAMEGRIADIMLKVNDIIARGFDGQRLMSGLAAHVRNVMLAKDPQTLKLIETGSRRIDRYREQAAKCPHKFLYKALRLMNDCDINYRTSGNKRLLVELTLIEMAQITQEDDEPAGRSPKRLKSLFRKIINEATPETARQVAEVKPQIPTRPDAPVTGRPTEPKLPASAPRAKFKSGNIGTSFASMRSRGNDNDIPHAVAAPSAVAATPAVFTDADVLGKWRAMCDRMPAELKGSAARMRVLTPRVTTCPDIEVVVDNKMLLDDMTQMKGRILSTLAADLGNPHVTINFRLAQPDELTPVMSRKEILENIISRNHAVKKLCDALDFEFV